MKKLLFSAVLISAFQSYAQNVGINSTGAAPVSSAALDVDMSNKGILIPRVGLSTTAAFAPVTGTATTSLMVYNTATAGAGLTAVTPGYYYWDGAQWVRLLSGASTNDWKVGTSGATVNTPGATGFLGTSDASHVELVTSGVVRGRLSSLGEFFIGTTSTTFAGDLMSGVANATFPFAVNGYSNQNGVGIYGLRMGAAPGVWGSVQGETEATIAANNSGVAGLAVLSSHRGVIGQKPAGGLGWGGVFVNDLGYTGGFYNASDERLKINVQPLTGALSKVNAMNFYSYNMDTIHYSSLGSGILHYGVMAQELKTVVPSLVAVKNIDPGKTRTGEGDLVGPDMDVNVVNYLELVPIALQAIKEQQAIIAAQEQLILELQKRMEELEKKAKQH